MKRIAFIVPQQEEHKLFDLFSDEYRGKHEVFYVTSMSALQSAHRKAPLDAIILNWDEISYPQFIFESIAQDSQLSICPVITYSFKIIQWYLDFFKEYSFNYFVSLGHNYQKTVFKINDILEAEAHPKRAEEKIALAKRTFFHHMYNGRYEEAEETIHKRLRNISTPQEIVYYRALILKTKKEFAKAKQLLAHGMNLSANANTIDIRFLHLLGNVFFKNKELASAIKFLEAAEKISSMNLRRKFIIGQIYVEMDRPDTALTKFSEIYDICPIYPGIHSRMVELKYRSCHNQSDIDELAPLITQVSGRKLVKLYKSLKDKNISTVERRLLDLVIKEFSKHGERLIAKNDFYGSLKYYNHIKQIIEPHDIVRTKVLLFCYARLYVKAGDFTMAEKYIAKSETLETKPDERILELKKLIVQGRMQREKATTKKSA